LVEQAVLLPQLGHSIARRFEQTPGEAAVASSRLSMTSPIAEICPPPPSGVGLPPVGREPLSSSQLMIVGEGQKVERFAKYVSCVLEHARPQLCQAGTRGEVATLVKSYFSMRRSGLRVTKQIVEKTDRNGDFDAVHRGLARRPQSELAPAAANDSEIRSAVLALFQLDSRLMANLRALVREGRLGASDFSGFLGLGMPDELEPEFAEVKVLEKACR
jgi:hypothetical protein